MMRLLLSGFSTVSTLKANTETSGILPIPLESYAEAASLSLGNVLAARASFDPFNVVALVIFVCAIVHTFLTARIRHWPRSSMPW